MLMNSEDMLIKGAQEMNVNLDEDMVKQFNQYTKMLLEWNNKMNLTNIVEDKDIIVKHYLDSLAAINTGCIRDGHRVADIGTGAGFPGLPVKIVKKILTCCWWIL
jgi:16S rRNA (guanine527-N7)-methyltransferase